MQLYFLVTLTLIIQLPRKRWCNQPSLELYQLLNQAGLQQVASLDAGTLASAAHG
jgi:hypothetical protein